ncbi:MAG: response regulator [Deltaproteobacteria bacterium]|nr:response regulator [Deltaproteobacteria bacterium]
MGRTFTLYWPQNYTGANQGESGTNLEVTPPTPSLPVDADFSNKKVLVVDDDIRNIYAITSVLEAREMRVIYAENGKIGVKVLEENPDIDLVLMDTMMPEMDGIEATQRIRELAQFKSLPIISLTAKAMKGDREKCLSAGASDYVTKPVDPEKLLAIMYSWLNKQP